MRIELVLGALLAVYIIAIMVVEIVMRYVFNNSIIWIQESVMLAFIWITALGASYALMTGSHITIDTFGRFLPGRGKQILQVFGSLVILFCLFFLASTLPKSIDIQNRSKTASLPVNFPKGWYYSLPIMVSVCVMIPTALYYLYYQIREMIGLPLPACYRIGESPAIATVTATDAGRAEGV
jgi:TRAP-type C4-dicarboxylate transport system permease small subunit